MRAITVRVAILPRNLGGKYRNPLHPWSRKCACYFFRETDHVKSNYARLASSAWRQRHWSDAHPFFQQKWQVLHSYDISVLRQVGTFLNGVACLMKVRSLFKREFPCLLMTWHTGRARMWSRRCKQKDSRWFQGPKICFWRMWSTISWNLS